MSAHSQKFEDDQNLVKTTVYIEKKQCADAGKIHTLFGVPFSVLVRRGLTTEIKRWLGQARKPKKSNNTGEKRENRTKRGPK